MAQKSLNEKVQELTVYKASGGANQSKAKEQWAFRENVSSMGESRKVPRRGFLRCLHLYTLVRLVVTSLGNMEHILYISSSNRDIEKIIVLAGIFDLSPKWSPRSGVQAWHLPVIYTYPCKTLFKTVRLRLPGIDIPCL
ncbi:hypothetical protein AVEN_170551-1 [Araneus ventricosus]|uniref:Uncharacterized protein n=1 Tax=Araneus ventricosus TaxID=182803 RepID=A0A4Y2RKV1_ARAVE|nr:hypothetical protein AVEN_170551-1 [Araneus ventricosus]